VDSCQEKDLLRLHYRTVRKNIENREQKDNQIATTVLPMILESPLANVFLYQSLDGEVATQGLVERLGGKKNLFVPKVVDGVMYLQQWCEAKEKLHSCVPDCIAIVPLIAFDDTLCRLGFGGGFYDKYLASNSGCETIGLAYDEQHCAKLPRQAHDVCLQKIVTPSKVWSLPKEKEREKL